MRSVLTGLFMVALLGFVSCSDSSSPSDNNNNNNNNNTPPKNYAPLAKGNSWVYDDVDLDTLSGEPIPSSMAEVTDSIVAVGTISGRADAYTLNSYLVGAEINSSVVAKTSTTYDIRMKTPFLEEFIEDTKASWRSVIDFSKDTWKVLDTNLADITFLETEFEVSPGVNFPVVVKGTGNLKMNGRKGSTSTLTVDGKSVNAQEYIVETTIAANLAANISIVTFEPLNITTSTRIWFAEDIGIVKSIEAPFKVEVKYSGVRSGTEVQQFLGKERTLKRYQVSK